MELPLFGFGGAPLGELFVKVSGRCRGHAAGRLGPGHSLFRYRTLVRARPVRTSFGRFLYRQPRAEFVLSTKVGRVLKAPRNPAQFDLGFWSSLHFDHVFDDYSYDGIMRAYEDCLQRLGMNRIDLLIIHDLDFWHHSTSRRCRHIWVS